MMSPADNVSIKSMEFSPIIGVLQGSHKNDGGFASSKKDIEEPLENVLENWNHDNRNERTIHNELAKKVLDEKLYNNQELLKRRKLQRRELVKFMGSRNKKIVFTIKDFQVLNHKELNIDTMSKEYQKKLKKVQF